MDCFASLAMTVMGCLTIESEKRPVRFAMPLASMTRSALRECTCKGSTLGLEHAALGDQPGDQPRRRDVEGVVGGLRAVGNHAHGFDAAIPGAAGHLGDFACIALLNR